MYTIFLECISSVMILKNCNPLQPKEKRICKELALVQASESKSDAQVIRAASLPANFEQCSAELDRFLAEHRWWVVVT